MIPKHLLRKRLTQNQPHTTYSYDNAGRLLYVDEGADYYYEKELTDIKRYSNLQVHFTYDTFGRLASVAGYSVFSVE